jgi:hypothetical protein
MTDDLLALRRYELVMAHLADRRRTIHFDKCTLRRSASALNKISASLHLRPMSPLISSIAWVRRGAAAENPEKYNLDEKELERVQKLARIELEDAQLELQRASQAAEEMNNRSDEEGSAEEDDGNEEWEE